MYEKGTVHDCFALVLRLLCKTQKSLLKKTKQCDQLARTVSILELDQKHLKEKLYDFYQIKKTLFDPVDFGIDRVLTPNEEM